MADLYTDQRDEDTIRDVLRHGLETPNAPKWIVLRIALAISLRIPAEPDDSLDRLDNRGSEYHLEQITGSGQQEDELGRRDFTNAFRALLSIYHNENLFDQDGKRFRQLLQRHIRRGLREIRTSWRPGHDFHAYLLQDLFAGIQEQDTSPDMSQELLHAFRDIGVTGEIKEIVQGPRITRYFIYLPDVNHLDRLRSGLDKLALSLGLQRQGVFLQPTDEVRTIGLDVPRPRETWQPIPGALLHDWAEQPCPADVFILPVWPGVDALGEPFCFDLAATPHLLVAGTTGSGKSICLHSIILSLLWRFSPQQLQLCLIDPKKVEFAAYEQLPHLLTHRILDDVDSAHEALDLLIEEVENRTNVLKAAGVSNLAEGVRAGSLSLPWIVVFIEELADLLMQSREIEEPIIRLVQKARSTGIHLVLATQRPDAETFSGLLRSNAPARIALSVQKASESKIILDGMGAEKLLGKGDMLVMPYAGSKPERVHGVFVTRDDIAACLRNIKG